MANRIVQLYDDYDMFGKKLLVAEGTGGTIIERGIVGRSGGCKFDAVKVAYDNGYTGIVWVKHVKEVE